MEKIDLKFGFSCNNKCVFCVQGKKREQFGNLCKEEILNRLKQGREESDKIVFTGGEVTIRDDFIELVRAAQSLGYKLIQIQTNGRMFSSKEFCIKTIEAGATEFSLALHGHNKDLHDYLTKAEGSFYQTVKGIRNLKELGQYVGTNSVITKPNYRNLEDMVKLLLYLNVDQLQLAFVHGLGTAGENFYSIIPRYSLIKHFVHSALDIGIRAGKVVMTEAIPYCFMENYENYIAEKIIPRTKIFDREQIIEDYTEYRLNEGKSKGAKCCECRWNPECEGPWKEYPENYGWEEFIPVY